MSGDTPHLRALRATGWSSLGIGVAGLLTWLTHGWFVLVILGAAAAVAVLMMIYMSFREHYEDAERKMEQDADRKSFYETISRGGSR